MGRESYFFFQIYFALKLGCALLSGWGSAFPAAFKQSSRSSNWDSFAPFFLFFFFPPGVWLGIYMGLPQNRCCATIILALFTENEISAVLPRVSGGLLNIPAAGLAGGGSAATCFVCLSMWFFFFFKIPCDLHRLLAKLKRLVWEGSGYHLFRK